jgi:Domain of unknown function (DUF1905)
MEIEFNGKIIFWKGPSPFLFVPIPAKHSRNIKVISQLATYGWGVIPVRVWIGETEFTTSLFPKDSLYLVPIKVAVQKAENLKEGSKVKVRLEIRLK